MAAVSLSAFNAYFTFFYMTRLFLCLLFLLSEAAVRPNLGRMLALHDVLYNSCQTMMPLPHHTVAGVLARITRA